ncbi:MAG TPA: hypothetical protein VNV60_09285 [Holophagaceae bacterium]|nr:hypothetical protein [Holophagaceae bacterium]
MVEVPIAIIPMAFVEVVLLPCALVLPVIVFSLPVAALVSPPLPPVSMVLAVTVSLVISPVLVAAAFMFSATFLAIAADKGGGIRGEQSRRWCQQKC